MNRYLDTFTRAFADYADYVQREFTSPRWPSYLLALMLVSSVAMLAEWIRPWRSDQPRIRRDFWLDAFYMLFNFFLFSLLGFHAVASVAEQIVVDVRLWMGVGAGGVLHVETWPVAAQLVVMFVARDFIQWWIHRALHRIPFLWEFHKVHHSVREMGFAAHLRYHWMETVVYRTLEYAPLALIGFGIREFFAVHLFALSIGHLNHSNLRVPMGPLRFVFNSPQMHIWHHAKELPSQYGVNFGLSLSVWDWLFGTAYWPSDGRDVELGFHGVKTFPVGFWSQMVTPFGRLVTRRADRGTDRGARDGPPLC